MKTNEVVARLEALHLRTSETPLFNPVFQLSLELSREIESGELSLDDLSAIVRELESAALTKRAKRLQSLVEPDVALVRLSELLQVDARFEDYVLRWSRPILHAVFTAHPTFLLAPAQSTAIARATLTEGDASVVCAVDGERPRVTLDYEHACAMRALAHAQDARDQIVWSVLNHAKHTWPGQWQGLRPLPFRFATWVGYDMDGRTDIGWQTSIAFRLKEKAERLDRYAKSLKALDAKHTLISPLRAAAAYARERAADFTGDLSDPGALIGAANRLTAEHPDKLLSLSPVIEQLECETDGSAKAVGLRTIAAAMRADGLGMGWIHFRVNATQLHNAIRRRLPRDHEIDLASQGAIVALRALLEGVKPLRVNFAALAIESSTAIRQFLAMTQILHHIDNDAPVRMLIAECEQPSTVLAALYFARLFGIEEKVDVSPLFETEVALEHGGRLLDALLAEPDYQNYARRRGRVSVQTGFSDAGRFVGQIPASLGIERLQGRLAAAMKANGLADLAALVFNTHGESMGRGCHPSSFEDRLEWPLSPWARRQFDIAGIRIEPEVSFQGGDGYLFFANAELALGTLTRIAATPANVTDVDRTLDPFYRRTDLTLDFYRAIKDHQREHLESRTYNRAITAFGLGLLLETGSRKSRRQSDLSADRDMSLRQIRAIPHNAVLQQLGYPINVIAGLGSAADGNIEELAALLDESARGRQIVRLIQSANSLASIKTVAAYGELFNSAYWASRTYRGVEEHLAPACAALAEYLTKDDRNGVFRRLASRLRVDALKLHRLLGMIPSAARAAGSEQARREIGVLQAVRLSLLQHMFLRAVSVPAFARVNDVSRGDVLEMILTLRIDEALAQLRRAYPLQAAKVSDFKVDEAADYPDAAEEGYSAIHCDYIDRIAGAHAINLRIASAIANHFGSHG